MSDATPFVSLNNKDQLNVAGYIRNDKYKFNYIADRYDNLFNHIASSLGMQWHRALTFSELQHILNTQNITHLFLAHEEYMEDRKYFQSLSSQLRVILVQDREFTKILPVGMQQILKPFYILPIVNVLNGDNLRDMLDKHAQYYSSSFIAPEARVLVVDDNEMNLKVATGLMQPYGIQVFTATSGMEAIQRLSAEHYDIIFMDHMMPEMDGMEATELIRSRSDEYSRTVPVIALTANAIQGVRELFLQNGFQDFVAKPIEVSALERVLKKWIPKDKQKKLFDHAENPPLHGALPDFSFRSIDSTLGLHYSGDKLCDYISFLEIYEKESRNSRKKIINAYSREAWKEYSIYVHALKSTSMSIGASTLSSMANSIESAAKEDNSSFIKAEHGKMIELHRNVLDEIHSFLESQLQPSPQEVTDQLVSNEVEKSQSDQGSMTTDEFLETLDKINGFLINFDQDAVLQLMANLDSRSFAQQEIKTLLQTVREWACRFEFDAAIDELSLLRQQYSCKITQEEYSWKE